MWTALSPLLTLITHTSLRYSSEWYLMTEPIDCRLLGCCWKQLHSVRKATIQVKPLFIDSPYQRGAGFLAMVASKTLFSTYRVVGLYRGTLRRQRNCNIVVCRCMHLRGNHYYTLKRCILHSCLYFLYYLSLSAWFIYCQLSTSLLHRQPQLSEQLLILLTTPPPTCLFLICFFVLAWASYSLS